LECLGDLGYLSRIPDNFIREDIESLESFLEFSFSTRRETDETNSRIILICFLTDESDFLHRKQKSRDSRGGKSDFLGEIDSSKFLILGDIQIVENNKII
jgi:hypothetical protein